MSSNIMKENERRERIKEQFESNVIEKYYTLPGDEDAHIVRKKLHEIEPCSTKFMTPDDQILLAVDQIGIAEIRAALLHDNGELGLYDVFDGVHEYTSTFSLNNGDVDALEKLVNAMMGHEKIIFSFADDDSNDNESDANEVNERTSEYKESTQDRLEMRFLIIGKSIVAVIFDLYDNGTISNSVNVPSSSIAIVITRNNEPSESYTDNKIKWEYRITFHCADPKKPRDALMKTAYEKMQRYMRAAIGGMGVLPSKMK